MLATGRPAASLAIVQPSTGNSFNAEARSSSESSFKRIRNLRYRAGSTATIGLLLASESSFQSLEETLLRFILYVVTKRGSFLDEAVLL